MVTNPAMTVTLHPATPDDEPVLRRLLELYRHDFSEVDGADLDERGLFGYPYLDRYWTEPDRSAFLLRVEGRLAGFVLINGHTYTDEGERAVAEFFVVRKYRRRGVGRRAAIAVFERIPGVWEVPVRAANAAAHAFWRAAIEAAVGAAYDLVQHEAWPGSIFRFTAGSSG
jgi:predicted acetyltransferase